MIEAIGAKILPAEGNRLPVARRQQRRIHEAHALKSVDPLHYIAGVDAVDSARAIRRYLQTRRTFTAPEDLEVFFDERSAMVMLAGTVPDEDTRALIVSAAGNIHGVERIDDRMRLA